MLNDDVIKIDWSRVSSVDGFSGPFKNVIQKEKKSELFDSFSLFFFFRVDEGHSGELFYQTFPFPTFLFSASFLELYSRVPLNPFSSFAYSDDESSVTAKAVQWAEELIK